MSVETSYQVYSYGHDNPLPLKDLEEFGPNVTRTSQYLRGKKIFKDGGVEVKEAGFLQLMALDDIEGREVANLSRDIRWDGETDIREFATSLARAILGNETLEPKWYGNLQFTMYFEGDLSPEEVVRRMVYSPTKLIKKYMPHFSDEADNDELVFEKTFLGEGGKGQTFLDIYTGRISGQFPAWQEGSGRGFVWGGQEIEDRKLRSISPTWQPQTNTELAMDENTEPAMRDNLLEDEEKFTGKKNVKRWAVKFTVDLTRTCCLYATASQSEVKYFTTSNGERFGVIIPSEVAKCFVCQGDKNSSDVSRRCRCSKK